MPFSSVLGANSVVRPGVCTSTTRPSVPYDGQMIYETDTNLVKVYEGAAWVIVGPQPPGLELISTTTIGTAVSSVTVTGSFSATYENYFVIVSGGAASTNNQLRLTLGATTTGYYWGGFGYTYAGSTSAGGAANIGYYLFGYGAADGLMGQAIISQPQLAKRSGFSGQSAQMQTSGSDFSVSGYLDNATQYTAFTLTTSTGTITGGTVKVYGYKN